MKVICSLSWSTICWPFTRFNHSKIDGVLSMKIGMKTIYYYTRYIKIQNTWKSILVFLPIFQKQFSEIFFRSWKVKNLRFILNSVTWIASLKCQTACAQLLKSGKIDIWICLQRIFIEILWNQDITSYCEIHNVPVDRIDSNIHNRKTNHHFKMSMLERLTIRGIRNFGVDAEDEQVREKLISRAN